MKTGQETVIEKLRERRRFPPPEVRRRLRERAGLTQADVALAIGCDRAAVSRWEGGTRHPRPELLRVYEEFLDRLMLELAVRPENSNAG